MTAPVCHIDKPCMIAPSIEDLKLAEQQLHKVAIRTPLLTSNILSERLCANILLKPENLQRTGSFKFRGAYNALSQLSQTQRSNGVVATSSGNHAQGVAEAARLLDISATIIMPSDAPVVKIERTRASGAKVILYNRTNEDRDQIANTLTEQSGASFVHPYNNKQVIAGQGTVGLEITQDMTAQNMTVDVVLVCTGGGGLTAGVALAVKHAFPAAKVFTCEPEGFDDYARSLKSGALEKNATASGSICDAILTPTPGEIGWQLNKELVSGGLAVSDLEALQAVRFGFDNHRLVLEPGGAVALAALQSGKLEAQIGSLSDLNIVVILSGGNVDQDVLSRALAT